MKCSHNGRMRLSDIVLATILNKFISKFHDKNCWLKLLY